MEYRSLGRTGIQVPPGVSISRADQGYQPPSLTDPFLRRRRTT
jgi:hypothetical protein